jgi:hypothetical protein
VPVTGPSNDEKKAIKACDWHTHDAMTLTPSWAAA